MKSNKQSFQLKGVPFRLSCHIKLIFTLFLSLMMTANAWAELTVVATLPDLAAVARSIGGQRVKVTALAQSTEDPHFVDARPSYLVTLSRADLLIMNGMELEDSWLAPLVVNSRNQNIARGSLGFLDASSAVQKRLEVPNGQIDRSEGDVHASGNPHYSYDPRAMLSVARVLANRLSQLDREGATEYQKNYQVWSNELTALIEFNQKRFAQLKSRQVVVYHRSWSYFADWLNLNLIAEVEPKPGIPPSPKHVASLTQTMKKLGVKVLLQESYYPVRVSKVIAKISQAKLLSIRAQAHFKENESYMAKIKRLSDLLYEALK